MQQHQQNIICYINIIIIIIKEPEVLWGKVFCVLQLRAKRAKTESFVSWRTFQNLCGNLTTALRSGFPGKLKGRKTLFFCSYREWSSVGFCMFDAWGTWPNLSQIHSLSIDKFYVVPKRRSTIFFCSEVVKCSVDYSAADFPDRTCHNLKRLESRRSTNFMNIEK